MLSKTKASIFTMLISIVNSVVIALFNLIYNYYLIKAYGSEINGLISTLNQFVSLFSIMEGGFTTAAVVATYEPIIKEQYKKLNDILYTVKKIYLKIGLLITFGVLVAGSIYIKYIDSPLGNEKTYAMLVVSTLTTVISLCWLSKYSVLLRGSNKEYIQVAIGLVAKTITWMISMLLIINNVDIILVYSINVLNVLLNVFLIWRYERKKFSNITYRGEYNKEYIAGTNDVFFQKIANTIFTSTDLVLVSAFINLAYASVYNLYFQIYSAILTLLVSIAQAPFNSFGQMAKCSDKKDKLVEYFNIYQHIVLLISTVVLVIVSVMVLPFVKLYTLGIKDFNYVHPSLVILFFSQFFSQIINRPYGVILNTTGNFKIQNIQCGLATIINLIVSVLFISYIGINSIVLGSFLGTLIILVMNIYQAYKKVLCCSGTSTIICIITNYIVSVGIIFIFFNLPYNPANYIELIGMALIVSILVFFIIVGINLMIFNRLTLSVLRYIRNNFVDSVKKRECFKV